MDSLSRFYDSMHFFTIPKGTVEGRLTCGTDLGGFYRQGSVHANTAYVCEGLTAQEELRVRLHETGHYVWFNRMSNAQREAWRKLHDNRRFVSEYAKTNAEEDFAETYAYYLMGNREAGMARKYRFLRNLRL